MIITLQRSTVFLARLHVIITLQRSTVFLVIISSADLRRASFLLKEVPGEVGCINSDTVHGSLHLLKAGEELDAGVGVLDSRVDARLDTVAALRVHEEPEALFGCISRLPQLHLQFGLEYAQLPQSLSVTLDKLLHLKGNLSKLGVS